MGRPKAGEVNKSQAIRDVLAGNPKAKSKEVVAALAGKGISVSPNQVYLIKAKSKGKQRRQHRAEVAATAPRTNNPAAAVMQVKDLAHQLGGIKNLKQLVDALNA